MQDPQNVGEKDFTCWFLPRQPEEYSTPPRDPVDYSSSQSLQLTGWDQVSTGNQVSFHGCSSFQQVQNLRYSQSAPQSPAVQLQNERETLTKTQKVSRIDAKKEIKKYPNQIRGNYREFLMKFIRIPEDLMRKKRDAIRTILEKIKDESGLIIDSYQIEKLWDQLKKKRNREMKEINEKLFEGFSWDVNSFN